MPSVNCARPSRPAVLHWPPGTPLPRGCWTASSSVPHRDLPPQTSAALSCLRRSMPCGRRWQSNGYNGSPEPEAYRRCGAHAHTSPRMTRRTGGGMAGRSLCVESPATACLAVLRLPLRTREAKAAATAAFVMGAWNRRQRCECTAAFTGGSALSARPQTSAGLKGTTALRRSIYGPLASRSTCRTAEHLRSH